MTKILKIALSILLTTLIIAIAAYISFKKQAVDISEKTQVETQITENQVVDIFTYHKNQDLLLFINLKKLPKYSINKDIAGKYYSLTLHNVGLFNEINEKIDKVNVVAKQVSQATQITFVTDMDIMEPKVISKGTENNYLLVSVNKKNVGVSVTQQITASKHKTANENKKLMSNRAYQRSLDLANAGDLPGAFKQAAQAVKHDKYHHDARKMLILAAIDLGKADVAEKNLKEAILLQPNSLVYLSIKAKLLAGKGMLKDSLDTLLPYRPNIHTSEEHYAFIAALYQQLKQHKKALNIYEQLVKAYPQKGKWWAGLAISLDSLGHENQALVSFQKANSLGGLDPQLLNYVNTRIDAIQ